MSDSIPVIVEPEDRKDALSLVDHLDPAIGEATSVVGAMLTELLRRTLRGGVMRIGDEMHGYVSQKVDTVIADRTPGLEQLAADVAEHTARTAATEIATEEVHALEERTQASDRELAGRITETARTAEQRTSEAAAALNHQIQETEQRTRAALQEQVQGLVDRARERSDRLKAKFHELENADAALVKLVEQVRQDLARLMHESEGRLGEEIGALKQVNQELASRVAELEKPRGLRALWARLFGRRKSKPVENTTASTSA
jgi:chromosome segregation ATPase